MLDIRAGANDLRLQRMESKIAELEETLTVMRALITQNNSTLESLLKAINGQQDS